MDLGFGAIWEIVDKGGMIALALFMGVAFLKGWIVPSWAYSDLKTCCETATALAERATELGERQADAAAVLIKEVRELQQRKEEEAAAKLLSEIRELHRTTLVLSQPARRVELPPEDGS